MGFLKQTAFTVFKYFVWLLDLVVPKRNNLFVFGCLATRYFDNARYFFEYVSREAEGIDAVWLSRDQQVTEKIQRSFGMDSAFRLFSVKGIWVFLRAKVAVFSHGGVDFFYLLSTFSPKLCVMVWHGQPLKNIGYEALLRKTGKSLIAGRYDLFVASSRVEAHTIWACFRNHVKEVVVTGMPRNDVLLLNSQKDLGSELRRFSETLGLTFIPKHVLLYAPTYRPNGVARFFPFNDLDFETLDTLMKQNQALLILRSHLNDLLRKQEEQPSDSDLLQKIVSSPWCRVVSQVEIEDINDFLNAVTLLITDYSGIFFDYLLLNRPIFFIPYDLASFKQEVGFLYPYEFTTPGPKILSGVQFVEELRKYFQGVDEWRDHRDWVRGYHVEVRSPIARKNLLETIRDRLS